MTAITIRILNLRIWGLLGAVPLLLSIGADPRAQDAPKITSRDWEKPIQIELDYSGDACKAHLAIEYYQRGDKVHVRSELTNEDCAASSGEYSIRVRYRDENGEMMEKDYPETWQRLDAAPVVLEKDYVVQENVDVMRVRSRKLSCECATPRTESETEE